MVYCAASAIFPQSKALSQIRYIILSWLEPSIKLSLKPSLPHVPLPITPSQMSFRNLVSKKSNFLLVLHNLDYHLIHHPPCTGMPENYPRSIHYTIHRLVNPKPWMSGWQSTLMKATYSSNHKSIFGTCTLWTYKNAKLLINYRVSDHCVTNYPVISKQVTTSENTSNNLATFNRYAPGKKELRWFRFFPINCNETLFYWGWGGSFR